MRRILLAIFLLLALWCGGPAAGAEPSSAEAAEIRAVIARQIEAFRDDNGVAAFAIAAPAIQKMFGDPASFMAMVEQSYLPVFRAERITFAELLTAGGDIVQKVVLAGPDGVPVVALYGMERDTAGDWRINGCVLVRQQEAPA